jgi:hypothetical protein
LKTAYLAAIAIFLWYLMVPPPLSHSSLPVDLHAPLSDWRFFSTHESATDCEKGLTAFYKAAKTELLEHQGNEDDRIRFYQLENSQCISSDDLPLKFK